MLRAAHLLSVKGAFGELPRIQNQVLLLFLDSLNPLDPRGVNGGGAFLGGLLGGVVAEGVRQPRVPAVFAGLRVLWLLCVPGLRAGTLRY